MEAKLYVGNLPYSTSAVDLQNLFAQAGTVQSAQVIMDRQTRRSKGFAFIEMSSTEEAEKAISMFHGKEISGRPLTVNLARPRAERTRSGGKVYRGGRLPGDSSVDAPPPRSGSGKVAQGSLDGDGTTDPPDPE